MVQRPDAQAFDEVRIITIPRYKESGISGDEWRISAETQFFRNGILFHITRHRNIEAAIDFLKGDWLRAIDDGKAYFGNCEDSFCDQEGCHEKATVFYKMKFRYCHEGHKSEVMVVDRQQFCENHKTRGDCGLDDADANYIPMQR